METGMVFMLGLVMGVMVGKAVYKSVGGYLSGGNIRPSRPPKPSKQLPLSPPPPPPPPMNSVIKTHKLNAMKAIDRVAGYIKLAEMTNGNIVKKRILLEKAEKILDGGTRAGQNHD